MVQGSVTSSQVKHLLGLHTELLSPEKSHSQEMGSEWRNRPREKLPAGDGFGVEEPALLNLLGRRRGEHCLIPSPSISLGSTAEPGAEQKESNDLVIAAAPRV